MYFVWCYLSWKASLQSIFSKDTLCSIYWKHKLHLSITCLAIFSWLRFCCPDRFLYHPWCSFWRQLPFSWSETLAVPWNFGRISEMPLLEILFFFCFCFFLQLLVHVLGHLHYLHFSLFILGSERNEFDLRIFTILRGIKSVLLQKNIY